MISVLISVFLMFSHEIVVVNETASYELRSAQVTGYTSSSEETDDTPFLTAAQTKTRPGVIACPRDIPFFTKVEIDGIIYFCEDRLNLRHTNRFDIWFPTKSEALEWGIQDKVVKVFK